MDNKFPPLKLQFEKFLTNFLNNWKLPGESEEAYAFGGLWIKKYIVYKKYIASIQKYNVNLSVKG